MTAAQPLPRTRLHRLIRGKFGESSTVYPPPISIPKTRILKKLTFQSFKVSELNAKAKPPSSGQKRAELGGFL